MLHQAAVTGADLEHELRGTGEPVILIHWRMERYEAEPLPDQPSLISRYQLLGYHRAGFAGSSRLNEPAAIATHAAHSIC